MKIFWQLGNEVLNVQNAGKANAKIPDDKVLTFATQLLRLKKIMLLQLSIV